MKRVATTTTLEKLLTDLVAFRTITGNHKAAGDCLDYAGTYLAGRGMKVRHGKHNRYPSLVACTRRTRRPKVLLQAHVDVVAAPETCFKVRRVGDRLLGRGVFDMKFAVAVFLKLADDLRERLSDYDFGIMLTSDEENGGRYGVKALLDEGYGADICLLPDAGDNWHIENGHKGYWRACVRAAGVSAHGSRPWEGDNAINRLVYALSDIQGLFEGQHKDSDTLSINKIEGGAAVNQVADRAQAWLDLRFIDARNYNRLRKKIYAIAGRHSVTLETLTEMEASNGNIDHPLIEPFLRIAEDFRGQALKPVYSLGGSDARYFAKHDIPVILVRPEGGSPHADQEWIGSAGLEKYYQVVKAYVQEVAAQA